METHRPLHIHPDTTVIFLTGRTYSGISWLHSDNIKDYFYDKLLEILPKYRLELDTYVICNNHYHLLLGVSQGSFVPKFVKHLHGSTARYIRQQIPSMILGSDQTLTREITPWDRRQREGFLKRTEQYRHGIKSANTLSVVAQFIARNPAINDPEVLALLSVKDPPIWYQYTDHVIRNDEDYYKHLNYIHQNPIKHGYVKQLTAYKWSSIRRWIKEKGEDFIADCFRTYPIADFEPTSGAD